MVKQLKHNLPGLPAIKGLHLLSVLNNLECDPTTAIKQEFPSLITRLEHSKVIMRSRSSQMLSLSHLALLENPITSLSQGETRIGCNGSSKSYIKGTTACSLVCWHGGCEEEE